MASARSLIQAGIGACGERRAQLADALLHRHELSFAARAVRLRQQRILDRQRRHAGGFEFFHRAHHVHRVAVAVIGIAQQRQLAGSADAMRLLGELCQSEQHDIRRAQHRE